MQSLQQQFVQFAVDNHVLKFGDFTLKSGRKSPYFFNTGLFNTGPLLARLGQFYAQEIINSGLEFDHLFGSAYKGIPLVSATAIALSEHHNRHVPYSFNRKEKKKHGDGGLFVGAPFKGRVLLIDDVISAGTTSREIIPMINAIPGAKIVGLIVALDRNERGETRLSASQSLDQDYNITTLHIASLKDIVTYLTAQTDEHFIAFREAMEQYHATYGVKA